jgi:hypothetical protein
MEPDIADVALRLAAAALVGVLLGLNRDLAGKPIGMRTLALVSLAAAVVSLSTIHFQNFEDHPDALSRVVQGIIQGVMGGIGFIGAGVILAGLPSANRRKPDDGRDGLVDGRARYRVWLGGMECHGHRRRLCLGRSGGRQLARHDLLATPSWQQAATARRQARPLSSCLS